MSNANFPNVHDYKSAAEYLGSKKERPCGNNTRIEMDPLNLGHYVITIKYHGNAIVNYYPDRITLHNQGWYTSTTKERLNHFIPNRFSVYQERGQWILTDRGINGDWQNAKRYNWAEGICLTDSGVYNFGNESENERIKAQTKRIKNYVSGFIDALCNREIEKPSGADCWYCLMHTESGESLGDATKNTDHIESHMEESYYVPSLLMNAIKKYPVSQFAHSTIGQLLGYTDGDVSDGQKNILMSQLGSSLTRYLKHELGIAA